MANVRVTQPTVEALQRLAADTALRTGRSVSLGAAAAITVWVAEAEMGKVPPAKLDEFLHRAIDRYEIERNESRYYRRY